MFEVLQTKDTKSQFICYDFEEAIDIWWIKPHVANRRLAGSVELFRFDINYGDQTLDDCASLIQTKLANFDIGDENTSKTNERKLLLNFIESHNEEIKNNLITLLEFFCKDSSILTETKIMICAFRKLLPRSLEKYTPTYELLFSKLDHSLCCTLFIPVCSQDCDILLMSKSFMFSLFEKLHCMQVSTHKDYNNEVPPQCLVTSSMWLIDTLFKKIIAWTDAAWQSETGLRKEQSLSLVDVEAYSFKYSALKKKYGPYFVEIWNENTDPLKYVYEDIGIATYLIILWEKERQDLGLKDKQSFVDLGCGNGLLVHILASEGHPGRGIDLNKRKIWEVYGENTILQEESLIPNKFVIEEDWIIGNHSDELTPWIPLIAARSSYNTRYFVLPCCFFDFNSKFHHIDHKQSHYESYLEYIWNIGTQCKIKVRQDTLRIPSTKRVCQVGTSRMYSFEDHIHIDNIVDAILMSASKHLPADPTYKFTPRSTENVIKNCSHVNEHTKTIIIEKVTDVLLSRKPEVDKQFSALKVEDKLTSMGIQWNQWNCGGSVHLNELAELFDANTLKELKAQCGGIQTLLKNNRNIFKVIGGMVELRDYRNPEDLKPSRKSLMKKNKSNAKRNKTKLCWFHSKHPQGCLFTTEECTYAHGSEELTQKQ